MGTAEEILKIMNDRQLLAKLRDNSFKAIREKFNLVKMAEQTYNFYKDITGHVENQ